MDRNEVKKKVLKGALAVLKERGVRFTMDDLAGHLTMSKKTIYKVFDDKESILCDLVDSVFDRVKSEQEEIMAYEGLSTVEKLRGILCVLPQETREINFAELYLAKERYP